MNAAELDRYLNNKVHIWSRKLPPDWTGRIIDWYQTLYNLIEDCSNGGDIITSPEVTSIMECSLNWFANLDASGEIFPKTQEIVGHFESRRSGVLKRWSVTTDPYFKRNKLVINPGTLEEQEIVVNHLTG